MSIIMDEIGRFWIANEDDVLIHGPYDTPEEAQSAYPEADFFT